MFPIGARTIDRGRNLGLELLTCWLGGAGDPSSILLYNWYFFKQRRCARHPLRHMGNTRVKY